MHKVVRIFEVAFAAIGGAISYFFGDMNGFLIALIIFMALDILTGLIHAFIKHEISSKVSFKGILKKALILLVVGLANVLDTLILPDSPVVRSAVICFYLANEGISILENMGDCGVPLPKILVDAIKSISKEEKENADFNP